MLPPPYFPYRCVPPSSPRIEVIGSPPETPQQHISFHASISHLFQCPFTFVSRNRRGKMQGKAAYAMPPSAHCCSTDAIPFKTHNLPPGHFTSISIPLSLLCTVIAVEMFTGSQPCQFYLVSWPDTHLCITTIRPIQLAPHSTPSPVAGVSSLPVLLLLPPLR